MTNILKIRCPVCKGRLIKADDLHCSKCNLTYPIKEGIPIMLTDLESVDNEQNLSIEKEFYEKMVSDLIRI